MNESKSIDAASLDADALSVIFRAINSKQDRTAVRRVCKLWRDVTYNWLTATVVVCPRDGSFCVHDTPVKDWSPLLVASAGAVRVAIALPTVACTEHTQPLIDLLSSFHNLVHIMAEGSVYNVPDAYVLSFLSAVPDYVSTCTFGRYFWASVQTAVTPVRFIDYIPHITSLNISRRVQLNSDCVHGMRFLTSLDCSYCEFDTGSFVGLEQLTTLNCSYCRQLSAGCFAQLPQLTSLTCASCTSLSTGCFDTLTQLRSLYCFNCTGLQSNAFDALASLTDLDCSHCGELRDSSFLRLPRLTSLDCSGCSLLTGYAFASLVTLCRLRCVGCTGIKTFENLEDLAYLDCSFCVGLTDGCFSRLRRSPI